MLRRQSQHTRKPIAIAPERRALRRLGRETNVIDERYAEDSVVGVADTCRSFTVRDWGWMS